MSGHWICEDCGSEWMHEPHCRACRPPDQRWMGNRTPKEMRDLTEKERAEIEARR